METSMNKARRRVKVDCFDVPPRGMSKTPQSTTSMEKSTKPSHLYGWVPKRPLPSNLLHHSHDQVLAFETDEDDYDDENFEDLALLDSMEDDGSFRGGDTTRKVPPKLPIPPSQVPKSKKRPNMLHSKRSVKVVSKRLHLPAVHPSAKMRLQKSDLCRENRLPGLSTRTWEERVYEFIRNKKSKEKVAAAQPASEMQETLKSVSAPPQQSSGVVANDELAGLELDERCKPLVEYLASLGLDEQRLRKIARRRRACFYVKVSKVKERLGYLMSLGIKNEDVSKVIVKHPQVLEYTVDGMMKPRVEYLQSLGVPETRLGRVITVSPSLLECSLEGSLKRRVKFLVEEVGVSQGDVWKVVLLSPQVLTSSINDSLRPRMNFLLKNLGMSQDKVAKMITKHPQLLHYSIKDGIEPRIDYLRSIGLSDRDIAKVLSRSSQILSLSVEKSLKPKCDYLLKELNCGLQTLISFPAYLSLSLEQRIKPRHKFLEALNRLPTGHFSMHIFAVTDQEYCERWAKCSIEEYRAFRQRLTLSNFAKEFEKRNRLHYDKATQ